MSSRLGSGKSFQDPLLAHPRGQVLEHLVDGDPKPSDAELPAPLIGSIMTISW